jgi:hypothetical protein
MMAIAEVVRLSRCRTARVNVLMIVVAAGTSALRRLTTVGYVGAAVGTVVLWY